MTIFRDFQGPRPRRDIGIARPRHSKTCLETETRLETSSYGVNTKLFDFFFKQFFVIQALDLLYMTAFIDDEPIDIVFGMISIS